MTGDVAIGAVCGGAVLVGFAYFVLKVRYQSSQRPDEPPHANEAATALGTALGATVTTHTERNDKKEYHLVGERSGHQVRLIFSDEYGEIEVKPTSKPDALELIAKLGTATSQRLRYDAEAEVDAQNQLNSDHWNERELRKYFLSRHVYCEDMAQSLRPLVTFWNQLPNDLTGAIIEQMEAETIDSVRLGSSVKISVNDTAMNRPGFAVQTLDLAIALVTAIEAPGGAPA